MQVYPRAPDPVGGLHVQFADWALIEAASPVLARPSSGRRAPAAAVVPSRPAGPTPGDGAAAVRLLLAHRLSVAGADTLTASIGTLIEIAWRPGAVTDGQRGALKTLIAAGIRPVPRCAYVGRGTGTCYCPGCADSRGRPVPRGDAADGLWLSNDAPVAALFDATDLAQRRWRLALLTLPGARRSACNVRIGRLAQHAIWLARSDLRDAVPELARPP